MASHLGFNSDPAVLDEAHKIASVLAREHYKDILNGSDIAMNVTVESPSDAPTMDFSNDVTEVAPWNDPINSVESASTVYCPDELCGWSGSPDEVDSTPRGPGNEIIPRCPSCLLPLGTNYELDGGEEAGASTYCRSSADIDDSFNVIEW